MNGNTALILNVQKHIKISIFVLSWLLNTLALLHQLILTWTGLCADIQQSHATILSFGNNFPISSHTCGIKAPYTEASLNPKGCKLLRSKTDLIFTCMSLQSTKKEEEIQQRIRERRMERHKHFMRGWWKTGGGWGELGRNPIQSESFE